MKTIILKILPLLFLFFTVSALGQTKPELNNNYSPSICNSTKVSNTDTSSNQSLSCPCRSNYTYSQFELELMYLINTHRENLGLNAYLLINHISNVCNDHNNDMIANNYFSHAGFASRSINIKCATNAIGVSENLAYAYNSPNTMLNAWLNSTSGHREAIENPSYTHFGISATVHPVSGFIYCTNIFAKNPSGYCSTIPNTIPYTCNLNPSSSLSTTNITYYNAQLNWNNVTDNDGYQIEYKLDSDNTWTTTNTSTSNNTKTISSLEYSSNYQWRVRTKCDNGEYSDWSNVVTFTTTCFPYYNITEDVNFGQTDIKQASNYINATNKIKYSAHAEYSAGNKIRLVAYSGIIEPNLRLTGPEQPNNFHAQSGSTFRAYIDDCSGYSSRMSNNNTIKESVTKNPEYFEEPELIENEIEIVKLYPNPTNGKVTIESTEDILRWELYNQFGKTLNRNLQNVNATKKIELNLSNITTGLYFIKITLKTGEQVIKRVIKK